MIDIIDGKKVSQKVRDEVKEQVNELKAKGISPKLAVIMVGENPASKVYVRNKSKACSEVGIEFEEYLLPETTKQDELLNLIDKLNNDKSVHGILVQSPLPNALDSQVAFQRILPEKDVDCFNAVNVGKMVIGLDGPLPCTPAGVIRLLEEYNIDIEGKNLVVLGRSNIVGKPMGLLALRKNATVTICHSKTKNLKEITSKADILISAIGKPKFVTQDMVKQGACVIDVGMNHDENGKLCGDVDFENVKEIASYITPVPGGVGPMTIAILLSNCVEAAKL